MFICCAKREPVYPVRALCRIAVAMDVLVVSARSCKPA